MKTVLFAIVQVILASGILYGYYHLMLRNKRFHQYNRFFLLASVSISMLIPFLNIPVYFEDTEIRSSVVLQTLQTISSPGTENETVTPAAVSPGISTPFNWNIVLYISYVVAIAVFLVRTLISLNKIRVIIKSYPVEDLDGVHFVNTTEPGTPYSFFRWLFWNKRIELSSEKGEQIFRHEIFHIQQKHSLDIIFIELVTAIFWINPFFHLIKKEQKAIHEFLADQFALRKTNKWEYAELLLMQAFNTQQRLVNPFFHNQIKRRIAMITNPKKTSHRYLRKLLVLPLTAVIVTLFAFKYKHRNEENNSVIKARNPLTIVVDAGHGGIDPGAKSPDSKYTEAQLNLEISKAIGSIANEYNINVVMTRTYDNLPGGGSNIQEGLINRVNLANMVKPVAFISIHLNALLKQDKQKLTGFEAYITKDRFNLYDDKLASAILGQMTGVYKTRMEINQRSDVGIFVLDKVQCPSVLLECGYIDNSDDLAFISKPKNQEKIARAILKGIVTYSNNAVEYTTLSPVDTVSQGLEKNFTKTIFQNADQKTPTAEQFKTWGDAKMYSIRIDGNRIQNAELQWHKPTDFGLYWISTLEKDKVELTKSYYQVNLMTWDYYEKTILHKTSAKITDTTHPLIVIDGKEKPGLRVSDLESIISANDIQVINVLKNEAATAKYGKAGKNGVIEIITKNNKQVKIEDVKIVANQPSADDNKIFEKVEIESSFPGGFDAWRKFLERNLDPTIPVKNHAPFGKYTVYIEFVVNKDGSVSNVRPLTNHGFGMEQEAMRVISKGPYWLPAIQNGQKVNAYRKQPVNFEVADGENYEATVLNHKNNEKKQVPVDKKPVNDLNEVTVVGFTDKVLEKVEIEPSFPGGETAWKIYSEKDLDQSIPVKNGAPTGEYTVWIQFIVHTDGYISDVKALTNHGFGMEEAAMRLIKKGPQWVPAIQNGQKVNAYKKQRVDFVIKSVSKNNDEIKTSLLSANGSADLLTDKRKAISEIKTIARTEGKAAYIYKGRTYIFSRITNPDPNISSFTEQDGTDHVFLLNGELVNSIDEINKRYSRNDVAAIGLIPHEESLKRFNINEAIVNVETFDKGVISKN